MGPRASSPPKGRRLTGTVMEKLDAGRYSYLRLATKSGERWVAVMATDVVDGQTATVRGAFPMKGFASTKLKRIFDEVWFGELMATEAGGAPSKAAPAAGTEHGTPKSGGNDGGV